MRIHQNTGLKSLFVASVIFIALGCVSTQETPQMAEDSTFPFTVDQREEIVLPEPVTISYRNRVIETFETYWPLISLEHQHQKLPDLLSDELIELRIFGIERVGVLLRDHEATDSELQLVVDMLHDDDATVRVAAAKLLPEINLSGLEAYVTTALAKETDDEVATAALTFFEQHPYSGAFEVISERIQTGPIPPAARAMIALLNTHGISSPRSKELLNIIKTARDTNNTAELITIEAMIGSASDRKRLANLLHNQDRQIRLAVAKGFAAAGYAEPLIGFAHDPDFYRFALAALQNKADIDAFISLMQLQNPDDADWDAAAISIASQLDTSSLLRADDMLKRSGRTKLRLKIFKSIWANASGRSLPAQRAIARRTVPLLIDQGDAVGALQLLDTFGESLVDDDLLMLRFEAAISASAWDTAEDAMPTPVPWIEAWQSMLPVNETVADVIKQQIKQRFESQLTTQQKEVLGIPVTKTDTEETENI